MAFTRGFGADLSGRDYVQTVVSFDDEDYVRFSVKTRQNYAEGRWDFDVELRSMRFHLISHEGKQAICIATCLGKAIGKPLLECLLDSRSLIDIGNCLDKKAIGAFADSVVCIGLCLGLV